MAATVIHYGHLVTDTTELKKINAPIPGLFGGQDRGMAPDDVEKFQESMETLGKTIDVKFIRTRAARLRIPTISRATGPRMRPTLGTERLIFWLQP